MERITEVVETASFRDGRAIVGPDKWSVVKAYTRSRRRDENDARPLHTR